MCQHRYIISFLRPMFAKRVIRLSEYGWTVVLYWDVDLFLLDGLVQVVNFEF